MVGVTGWQVGLDITQRFYGQIEALGTGWQSRTRPEPSFYMINQSSRNNVLALSALDRRALCQRSDAVLSFPHSEIFVFSLPALVRSLTFEKPDVVRINDNYLIENDNEVR